MVWPKFRILRIPSSRSSFETISAFIWQDRLIASLSGNELMSSSHPEISVKKLLSYIAPYFITSPSPDISSVVGKECNSSGSINTAFG